MAPTSRSTTWVAEEFDRRAATYDDSAVHAWQADQAVRILDPRPGQLILDVATGTGLAARAAVAHTGPCTGVVGIDVAAQMLQVAARSSRDLDCGYVQADAHRLPFKNDVFDAILCVAAIPYLHDLPTAAAEWRHVARPRAIMVFTTPAADGLTVNRLLRSAAAAHGVALPDPHADLGTPARIQAAAVDLGLLDVAVEQHSYPELLDDQPRAAFDKVLDYGFAEPLKVQPPDLRQQVFETYRTAHLAGHTAGEGRYDVLFTRCRLP